MSYRNLEIWQEASIVVKEVFQYAEEFIPRNHQYDLGSQIRRSVVSVKSNIVEGYGRRRYGKEYIRFMIYAVSSLDETVDHLETIKLVYQPKTTPDAIIEICMILGKKLSRFIQALERRYAGC